MEKKIIRTKNIRKPMIFSITQMFFEQWEHQDYLDNYVYIHMYNIYEHSTLECSFINIIFDEKQHL